MKSDGASVMGVDWRIPLINAWQVIGFDVAIQGNLDPSTLLGPWEIIQKQTSSILGQAQAHPGHIFNLGHGILPETPLENLMRLVEYIHQKS
jgi:uroporphyrinogen decarboxylase